MNHRLIRVLAYAGPAVAVFGLAKAHARWIGNYDFTGSSRFAWTLGFVALLWILAYGVGIPQLVSGRTRLTSAVAAALVPTLAVSFFQLLLGSALLPRFVVFSTALALIPWYLGCAWITGHSPDLGTRVLAVISADEAAVLRDDMARSHESRGCVATVIAPEKASSDEVGEGPLVRAAGEAHASVLVLNRPALDDDYILEQAVELHAAGVRVRTLERFYDEWLGKLPRHDVGRTSLLFDIGAVHRVTYNRVKRVIDAVIGVIGVTILVALIPVVALANLLGNRGPLLYRQPRVGARGQVFTIYKFRTMRPGPAAGHWTSWNDVRITQVGRWMRRIHLDELPQMLNILRGDLAVVGPRPEQPHYVEELSTRIPFYGVRHLVRPGLTGWAQVNYHYGSCEYDAIEKLRYDLHYLQHQSLTLDLRILVRSLRNVMAATGR